MKHEVTTLNTKKTLSASLKKCMERKPLSKITVTDIVNECGFNRKNVLEPVFTRKIWYNRRAMRYTSDMTDSQWEIIKPILQGAKYRSLEEKREQINAVFYLVKTGCQWRNLPKDFPKWKTVYSFYRRACLNGIWDKIQKALVKKVRLAKGKKETPSYALIDSQSAKTVSSNEKRGYDGGKKRKEEKDT